MLRRNQSESLGEPSSTNMANAVRDVGGILGGKKWSENTFQEDAELDGLNQRMFF